MVSCGYKGVSLKKILTAIFKETGITFISYSNHIILQQKKPAKNTFVLKGSVREKESNMPIPYATVQIKNTTIGTITDNEGRFELTFEKKYYNDTILFSFIGYERIEKKIQDINPEAPQLIFLSVDTIIIDPIEVNPTEYEIISLGNSRNKSTNNLYIDTHGQQSVLYVENERKTEGKIVSLNYYLSKKGNYKAPFRLRVYAPDSNGKPGSDLLPHMIIVKPNTGKGWYSVNISDYNVRIPESGFFIGIEGIYPNDYLTTTAPDSLTAKELKEFRKGEIAYGQEIGCVRKKKNNTWHYSLSHTWFKAVYTNLEIMVYADIRYNKEQKPAEKNNKHEE